MVVLAIKLRNSAVSRFSRFNNKAHLRICRSGHRSKLCEVLNATGEPIVSPSWVLDNRQDISLLDIRGRVDVQKVSDEEEKATYVADRDAYLTGHVPGAVFFDWTRDGIDTEAEVPVQLQQDSDLFAADLESKGVRTDRPVVVYDHGDGMFAARLWWMLRCHGHPEPLIMEGGWARWEAEGLPVELYEPCPLKLASTALYEGRLDLSLRVSAEELAAALGDPNLLVLDTRSEAQFDGKVRRAARGGRIPGAVKLPRRWLMDAGGESWLPLEQQKQKLLEAGVHLPGAPGAEQQRVVLYCNGGVAACTAALALHQLGHSNWGVYDGSWNEWGNRADLPVEKR